MMINSPKRKRPTFYRELSRDGLCVLKNTGQIRGAPGAALEAWEAYRLTDYHQPERGRFLPPATHW